METILQTLGLSERERHIMDVLLEFHRPIKSSNIAAEAELPRQTAYSALCAMAERGYIVQTDHNGTKYFYADAKELIRYIDLERDRLLKAKHALRGGDSYLLKSSVRSALPHVQFYDGALGLRKLFESILDVYRKGKSKKFRGYGINYFSNSKALGDYLRYFVKTRGSYGVKTNIFIGKGADDFRITNDKNAYGRTVKHIDIEPQMAGMYLVANRAYLFSYKDNVGVMIENQAIVNLLKDTFDDYWERVQK